jgi:hypothetical protein
MLDEARKYCSSRNLVPRDHYGILELGHFKRISFPREGSFLTANSFDGNALMLPGGKIYFQWMD